MLVRSTLSLVLLALALLTSEWIVRAYGERLDYQQHDYVLVRASEMRSRLESALNSTVFVARGLVGYVVGVGTPAEPQVTRALKAVYDADSRIRNVALAPANRITYIYPRAGNERAIGLRYEDHPEQWPSVEKAITRRQSVLAGPVQLIQGGSAIINRTPIYLNGDRYWGLISTVIDLPRLLADVGLAAEVDGVRYWLDGDNGDVRLDTRILGTADPPEQAISMTIDVPGGRWHLASAPATGWSSTARELRVLRIALYGLSLLFAAITYALLNGRATAQALAAELGRLNGDLLSTNRELHRLSRNDDLTMLPNRRSFEERFETSWQITQRAGLPMSVMMIDIDRFKSINDTRGHAAGDVTLAAVSAAIRGQIRRSGDLVARYGGEEFAVMVLGVEAAETLALAEKIRVAVRDSVMRPDDGGPVTVSIGVATIVATAEDQPQQLVERADRALYLAKNSGRDRVCSLPQLALAGGSAKSLPGPSGAA